MIPEAPTRPSAWAFAPLVLTVSYPVAIFVGLRAGGVELTAWVILGASLFQLLLLKLGGAARWTFLATLTAAAAALGAALLAQAAMLLLVPALTNLALGALFGGSLLSRKPLIERFARLRDSQLSAEKASYCRRVTQIWTLFFALNAATIAVLAAAAPLSWWTLYTGLVGYLLAGMLGVCEITVRTRRFGIDTAGPWLAWLLVRRRADRPEPLE